MKKNTYHVILPISLVLSGCVGPFGRTITPSPDPLSFEGEAVELKTGATDTKKPFEVKQRFINAAFAAQHALAVPKAVADPKVVDPVPKLDPKQALKLYFIEGTAMSDTLTDTWFSLITNEQQATAYQKAIGNIVGATTIAVLGFTGADAKQLALFGLGMAGMNAQFENYSNSYLLTDTLKNIHKVVIQNRNNYKDSILTALDTDKLPQFADVEKALTTYHAFSSRDSIMIIIEESVANVKYKIPDLGVPRDSSYRFNKLAEFYEVLMGAVGSLDPVVAQGLYVIVTADSDNDKPYSDMRIDPTYKPYVDKFDALKSRIDKTEYMKARRLLDEIAPLVNGPEALAAARNAVKVAKAAPGFLATNLIPVPSVAIPIQSPSVAVPLSKAISNVPVVIK